MGLAYISIVKLAHRYKSRTPFQSLRIFITPYKKQHIKKKKENFPAGAFSNLENKNPKLKSARFSNKNAIFGRRL
jgi:hypothetical protein